MDTTGHDLAPPVSRELDSLGARCNRASAIELMNSPPAPPPPWTGPRPRRRPSALSWLLGGLALACAGLAFWSLQRAGLLRHDQTPPGHWTTVRKARAYFDRGRPDLALKSVIDIRDEAPGAAEAMVVAGFSLIQLGKLNDARLALERGLGLNPRQPRASKVLAAVLLYFGDGPGGIRWLEHAAKLQSNDPQPWRTLGKVHHDLGDLEQSARCYTEALNRDTGDRRLRLTLVETLIEANQPESARTWLTPPDQAQPPDPVGLGLAARIALETGDLELARERAEETLKLAPENTQALWTRAMVARRNNQPTLAVQDLESLLRSKPEDLAALTQLAQVQAQMGNGNEAENLMERHKVVVDRLAAMDLLSKQIADQPSSPEPKWKMGLLAREAGQLELAANCFRATLDVEPSHKGAAQALRQLQRDHANLLGSTKLRLEP